jgi:hypothetical protein
MLKGTYGIGDNLANSLIANVKNIGRLLDKDLSAAIKGLDNNIDEIAKRTAFLQDLIHSKDIPDGVGANLGKLTPGHVGAWDNLKNTPLKTDFRWLTRINVWKAAGLEITEAGGIVKISKIIANDVVDLALIKNQTLLITKYHDEFYNPAVSGTPLGELVNGCQAYSAGGKTGFKRIPDFGTLPPVYRNFFVGHKDLHGAEKHFPDVVNDALSFRAYNVPQYGPDGFVNNASHATK